MAGIVSELRRRKPRIGVLGIMQELYIPIHPGIKERQESFAREVIASLGNGIEFVFPEAATNRESIERLLRQFNTDSCDGVIIIMLTYGASFLTYNALRQNRLPIFLANIQPEPEVGTDWDMADLTYNQGIHGAQDTGNALMWSGSSYSVWSGNWRDVSFRTRVSEWATVVRVVSDLPKIRISQVGQMIAMGDIQANPAELLRTFGIQIDQTGIGLIYHEMESVTEQEVDAVIAENRAAFEIDPQIPEDRHRYAARFQIGIKKFLLRMGYAGVSVYFNAPADDGRFLQIPLMAASNLMAEGFGYGGEGDVMATVLVTIGQLLEEDASFIEMYAMDFSRGSILMSHMGEGNWKIARTDRPIRLVDRPLGIGGLQNPPTTVFSAEPGPATLVTLITRPEGGFRLILSRGRILDTEEMPNVEMPYYHYKPDTGIEATMNGWLSNGGSHHQCIHLGDQEDKWRLFCEVTGIEFVRV
ncbi:MAG: L-fucose/L-arabinose isomerase family protein [Alkalispirochaeta sp.]